MIEYASTAQIEQAVNMPGIRGAFYPCAGYLDFSKFHRRPGNIALRDRETGAVMLFARHAPYVYEAHFAFPQSARGKKGIEIATAMLDEMFASGGACVITGVPPRDNHAVRIFGYRLGFRPTGAFFALDGVEYIKYELRKHQWVVS